MHFSLVGLLVLLLVAAVCGAIGRAIAGGSLLGSWIAHKMHLPELFVVNIDRHPFPVLWSVIGAALFVAVVHLISGRR
jgi:uncharacterized membrane protein YeaQ/YmgE (transglycosylase-associated protein family)